MDHGDLRTDLRVLVREHADPRGDHGSRVGRSALRHGDPYLRQDCGTHRGRSTCADSRGGHDVSVQQPRRRHGPADDRGRLLHGASDVSGVTALARTGRCRTGFRVPRQNAGGIDGATGARRRLSVGSADDAWSARPASCRRSARTRRGIGMVCGAHACMARIVASVSRRFDGQQLHESGARLQRTRPHPGSQPRGQSLRCRDG